MHKKRVRIMRYVEEIKYIGLRALLYRLYREMSIRIGLAKLLRPTILVNTILFLKQLNGINLVKGETFYQWWLDQKSPFFIQEVKNYKSILLENNPVERKEVLARGKKASKGIIKIFQGQEVAFGWPVNWGANPMEGTKWKLNIHSLDVLSSANIKKNGDIKITWEIGRFLHIPDILRAYLLSKDATLIDDLFLQIEGFEQDNIVNMGPHWISEQEVAIRISMLTYLLFFLRDLNHLTEQRAMLLMRQIAAGAEYCYEDTEFSRHCIRNNHFIAGILGMYLGACILPWHNRARLWKKRGRKYLKEALNNQWWPDGGYVQPAHNYHRLALDYLLWIFRLAEKDSDHDIVDAIRPRLEKSLYFLESFLDEKRGWLPNWGPNDGAQFMPWTSCDYPDFRPLLTSLSYATSGKKAFSPGLWDEQLFWLWGMSALAAPVVKSKGSNKKSFPDAGLHILKMTKDSNAVLRAGPIISRYGQQADQLHVDIWFRGTNIMLDAGSYLYGIEKYHNWFRSTPAHNTVSVADQDQMEPYRQFLYLGWPHAALLQYPEVRKDITIFLGFHDGYKRFDKNIIHGRLLAQIATDYWLVIDCLLSKANIEKKIKFCTHWHIPEVPHMMGDDKLRCSFDVGDVNIFWKGTDMISCKLEGPSDNPVDGYYSRYYGVKEKALSLHLTSELRERSVVVTVIDVQNRMRDDDLHISEGRVAIEDNIFNTDQIFSLIELQSRI